MTRRSVTNERYTIEDEHKGTTRKSASQAKPAKEAAGTVYVKDNTKKTRKEIRQEEAAREAKRKKRAENSTSNVQDSSALATDNANQMEMKRWRKIWWVAVGLGVLLVILSWFAKDMSGILFMVTIIGAYAMVGFALFIEFGKISRLRRKNERQSAQKLTSKQLKHQMEAERLEEARRAAKKSQSKFRRGSKNNRSTENFPMDESSEH